MGSASFGVQYPEAAAAKKKTLSQRQIRRIAKALADPRRHEILQQIGAKKCATSCADVRECQPVTAATCSGWVHSHGSGMGPTTV